MMWYSSMMHMKLRSMTFNCKVTIRSEFFGTVPNFESRSGPEFWTLYQICPDLISRCVAVDQNTVDHFDVFAWQRCVLLRQNAPNPFSALPWIPLGELTILPDLLVRWRLDSASSPPRKVSQMSIIDLWSPYSTATVNFTDPHYYTESFTLVGHIQLCCRIRLILETCLRIRGQLFGSSQVKCHWVGVWDTALTI